MEYKTRKYPQFSACGLNCGLCPRYYTEGTSKCPGCAGEGFSTKHPPCGVLSYSQRKGIEYCFLCDEYPCKKYDGADLSDSFITRKNQFHDFDKAKKIGLNTYETELNSKIEILNQLLENYDDGRKKSFFCVVVNLLSLHNLGTVLRQIDDELEQDAPIKVKSATVVHMFEEEAKKVGISLHLRKKTKS